MWSVYDLKNYYLIMRITINKNGTKTRFCSENAARDLKKKKNRLNNLKKKKTSANNINISGTQNYHEGGR